MVFFPIAFFGIVPFNDLLIMIGTQAVLKTAYEIVILPITKLIVNYIKRVEQTDVYDEDVSYSFWKISEV